ncbi:response regulator receiver protein [Pseudoalteromonas rubra]|uniref:Response regulator receiver protein n=1 Tax=Pseudoalteromonas rubra TaxID=43658 RepID=A0A5S3WQA7_9GAMM|nr:response regulator [Pseudoalteromonas rubra]TMP30326.1 response regulator receiver protein [Pseudoalteromonas rubra]TMP35349.1 response regulator receiver protein [Pseudoalteromonas rubra]
MQDVSFLVVDDCQLVRNLVRTTLVNRLGAENVYTAEDGQAALELLDARHIDIIIADWQMPNIDGEELLKRVRKSKKHSKTPFIMMSSLGDREHVVCAIQNGVSQYMMKPFTADKLEETVHKSWNTISRRGAIRLSGLPEHSVRIRTGSRTLSGHVKNISQTGMLLQSPYSREMHLFNTYELELDVFDLNGGNLLISPLYAVPVRIVAVEGFVDTKMCQLALRFNRDMLNDVTKRYLDELLKHLGGCETEMIQDN